MKAYAEAYIRKHPNANKYEVEMYRMYNRTFLIGGGAMFILFGCFVMSMAEYAGAFSLLAGIAFLAAGIVYYKK